MSHLFGKKELIIAQLPGGLVALWKTRRKDKREEALCGSKNLSGGVLHHNIHPKKKKKLLGHEMLLQRRVFHL